MSDAETKWRLYLKKYILLTGYKNKASFTSMKFYLDWSKIFGICNHSSIPYSSKPKYAAFHIQLEYA